MVRFLKVNVEKNIVVESHKHVIITAGDYYPTEDDWFILGDSSGGDIAIYLPPATKAGVELVIHKHVADNKIDVIPDGSDTIDEDNIRTLNQAHVNLHVVSDGIDMWHEIA